MTPASYAQLLSDAHPEHSLAFSVITAAYDLARYGFSPVTEESASAVAAALDEICKSTGSADR
jgi:hypothetical protein